ncbi:hypothetical protein BDFG_06980 [Blastomyces dermatitidis ATCC 26199]|nr:hypothetical protein BDFG_06980 [Blastomyces dermatitidis ATCC 26199]
MIGTDPRTEAESRMWGSVHGSVRNCILVWNKYVRKENSTGAHQAEPFATRNGPSQAGSFGAANTIEKSQVHSLQEKWKLQAACFGITVTLRLDMCAGRIEYAPSLFPTKP